MSMKNVCLSCFISAFMMCGFVLSSPRAASIDEQTATGPEAVDTPVAGLPEDHPVLNAVVKWVQLAQNNTHEESGGKELGPENPPPPDPHPKPKQTPPAPKPEEKPDERLEQKEPAPQPKVVPKPKPTPAEEVGGGPVKEPTLVPKPVPVIKKRVVAPPGQAPVIEIKAPQFVEWPHLAKVETTLSGGPSREVIRKITPEPAEGDLMYGFKEVTDADGNTLKVQDTNNFSFVGDSGKIYTIRFLVIGKDAGYDEKEVRIQFKDSRPAKVVKQEVSAPQNINDQLRKWAGEVATTNLKFELAQVAKAGHEAAAEIRAGKEDGGKAIELWKSIVYIKLGRTAYDAWTAPPNGRAFFDYINDMFIDNLAAKDSNPPNFLDTVCDILEGK